MPKSRLMIVVALLLASLNARAATSVPAADKNLIESHIAFLSDDLLEGRESGSRGYDIAARYVAVQFRRFGVLPKGDNGSYLQKVPLRAARLEQESPLVELHSKSGKEVLTFLDDFFVRGSLLESQSEVSAPLVFVGYGIQAPRLGHDDFAGIDVKGKILVELAGKPSNFPSEEGAHYSGSVKREIAAKYGAAGIITVQTPTAEKLFPLAKVVKTYQHFPVMGWKDPAGMAANEFAGLQNQVTVSMGAAPKLFTQVNTKLDDIYALAAANKPLPRMDLNLSARLMKRSTHADLVSSNVVGMIEGSDPRLKHEYVVFSAHLDHLGIDKEKTGDHIYNGAMDNAAGVATLLEAARMFGQGAVKPKRSILFVAVTGEEKGLLGADYFVNNPTVPAGAIVANVNLDMPLLTYDFSSIVAFGGEHSSLGETTAAAAGKLGLRVLPDPWPEEGVFTRSDQYRFVRKGIPALFIVTGPSSFRPTEQPAKLWEDFLRKHYHQPSDDLTLPFNFDAAARFAQINYMIALEIANAPARPLWNKGDFFGDTFKKQR